MNSAEYKDLKEQLNRLEAMFQAWLAPTISEQNRQMLTLPKEQRRGANREILSRKRQELKAAGKR